MDELGVDDAQAERMARRRRRGLVRPYVENLLTDTRLREAFTDDQAQALLDWGVAQIEAQAAALVDPAAATAEINMAAQAFQVGRLLRAINLLFLSSAPDATDRIAEWEHIQMALTALGLGSEERLARLATLQAAGVPGFEQLLGLLRPDSAESPPPLLTSSVPPLLAEPTAPAPNYFALEPAPTLSAMLGDLPDSPTEMPTFPELESLVSPADPDSELS